MRMQVKACQAFNFKKSIKIRDEKILQEAYSLMKKIDKEYYNCCKFYNSSI